MAEQWGFFSVPHLLRHGECVYNEYLRGPVALIPIVEHLEVELSLPVFTIYGRSVAAGIQTPNLLLAGPTLDLTHCATAVVDTGNNKY